MFIASDEIVATTHLRIWFYTADECVPGADPGFQKGGEACPSRAVKIWKLMIFMTHLINIRFSVLVAVGQT